MPYEYQVRIQRRVRRAILAAAAIAGLFMLLAAPERMLGWSGLGVGPPPVLELAFTEVLPEKPVAALRTPPSLGHLAFPAYAEWTEATEASCVECDWNFGYGIESPVDAVDTGALVQLERSSSPTQQAADTPFLASGLRGLAGGLGAVGGSGVTGGGSSLGAAARGEDGTSSQAETETPAEEAEEEVSDATAAETSEAVPEAGGAPSGTWGGSSAGAVAASDPESAPVSPPSLVSSLGSQAQGPSAGRQDEAWTLVEAGVIDPLATAGANPFDSGPDQRNVPPPAIAEPPTTPEPTVQEPPTTPDSATESETLTGPETPVGEPLAVPEPTQLILMGIALSAVVYRMRRG